MSIAEIITDAVARMRSGEHSITATYDVLDSAAGEVRTLLMVMVERSSLEDIEFVLQSAEDPVAATLYETPTLWTALHSAARRGDISIASVLLRNGAVVNAATTTGRTPIELASTPEMFELLLAHGVSTETLKAQASRVLHMKIKDNCHNMIPILVQHGLNVDAQDDAGKTALMHAVELNNLAAAETLLTAGANVDLRDAAAVTPCISAAYHGFEDMVKLLVKFGADIQARNRKDMYVFDAT